MTMMFNWINTTRNRSAGRAGTVAILPASKEDPRPVLHVTLFAETLAKAGLAIGDKVKVGIAGTAVGISKDAKGITIGRSGTKASNSGTGSLRIQLPPAMPIGDIVPGVRHAADSAEVIEGGTLVLDLSSKA